MASYVLTILNQFIKRVAEINPNYEVHSIVVEPATAHVVAKAVGPDPLVSMALYTALQTKAGQINWDVEQLSSPIELEDSPQPHV